MNNWKHEEVKGISDAIASAVGRAMSVPRAEGKCQASVDLRADGYVRMRCLQCGHVSEGFREQAVQDWNEHIVYR